MSIRKILSDDKKLDRIAKVAFKSVDKDGSGLIDLKEMEIVMKAIAKDLRMAPPTKNDIREVFSMLDEDGSGNLTINEFRILIKCVLESLL